MEDLTSPVTVKLIGRFNLFNKFVEELLRGYPYIKEKNL